MASPRQPVFGDHRLLNREVRPGYRTAEVDKCGRPHGMLTPDVAFHPAPGSPAARPPFIGGGEDGLRSREAWLYNDGLALRRQRGGHGKGAASHAYVLFPAAAPGQALPDLAGGGGAPRGGAGRAVSAQADRRHLQVFAVTALGRMMAGNTTVLCGHVLRDPAALFNMIDSENTGTVEVDTFLFAMNQTGLGLSHMQMVNLWSALDAQQSGRLDYQALVSRSAANRKSGPRPSPKTVEGTLWNEVEAALQDHESQQQKKKPSQPGSKAWSTPASRTGRKVRAARSQNADLAASAPAGSNRSAIQKTPRNQVGANLDAEFDSEARRHGAGGIGSSVPADFRKKFLAHRKHMHELKRPTSAGGTPAATAQSPRVALSQAQPHLFRLAQSCTAGNAEQPAVTTQPKRSPVATRSTRPSILTPRKIPRCDATLRRADPVHA